MSKLLIKNALVINEGKQFLGAVLIENELISQVFNQQNEPLPAVKNVLDADGKWLIPGIIDDQVHFREPGLTHKADLYTESRAAVAGGITSFMEMPNTQPQTLTQKLLQQKYDLAARKSLANYSFYMGASNDNIDELQKTDPSRVCGIKVFMGSSTGNMLVDSELALNEIFSKAPILVATHCEDEQTIQKNTAHYRQLYGENVPIEKHPDIRSAEACFLSSSLAVQLAKKHGTRLHVLHLSTGVETELFSARASKNKLITAEVCVHHLWFNNADYQQLGTKIKWNPAIKTANDQSTLLRALLANKIDVIATDHAPHHWDEKQNSYFQAPSGAPLVQHALPAMLELHQQGKISMEKVVEKMCHAPADIFQINKRGYIREGYYADLVLVKNNSAWQVTKENILYKCGWSPFEGQTFQSKITHTFVNGHLAYENGKFNESKLGKRLFFERV